MQLRSAGSARIIGLTLMLFIGLPVCAQRREGNLKPGDQAPDFKVQDTEGKKSVKLSELKGNPVVLIFGSCT